MKAWIFVLILWIGFGVAGVAAKHTQPLNATLSICTDLRKAEVLKAAGITSIEGSVQGFLVPNQPDSIFRKNLRQLQESELNMVCCNGFLPASYRVVGPEANHEAILQWAEFDTECPVAVTTLREQLGTL